MKKPRTPDQDHEIRRRSPERWILPGYLVIVLIGLIIWLV